MKRTEEIAAMFIREKIRFFDSNVAINLVVLEEDAEEYEKQRKNIVDYFESDGELERALKCECDPGELETGIVYRFYGRWVKHWKHGNQFHAETFTKVTPHKKTGVINYLTKAPHIGKKRAEALWKKYGSDAVKTLRTNPQACAGVINPKGSEKAIATLGEKLKESAAYLEDEKGVEDATIGLVSLLAGRGFPKRLPMTLIKKYGNRAAERVQKNPYILMNEKGVGFLRADDMYLDLGGDPGKLKRQTLAIWHGVTNDSNGHTWFGVPFIEAALREKIAGADAQAPKAVKLGLRSKLLAAYRDWRNDPWFTERIRSEDEETIAERVAWLITRDRAWPDLLMTGLSDHQQEQLEKAISKPVGIFAGDPGTGKSFTAARLVNRIAELNGFEEIAIGAPTGKAAVRVTEAMQSCGIDIRARTIHSLLGVQGIEDGRWVFDHNRECPLEQRYVIVDESSMLDVPIMAALLSALRDDAHLLLVGDLQQLPPVGHGAPLRDLITAGVPLGNLTEIRRNSGAIVQVCADIRLERPTKIPAQLQLDQGGNIAIREVEDHEAADRIEGLVKTIGERKLCDPTWELQVIVALNEKSKVSRAKLNQRLQLELNAENRMKGKFWPDDKIVCTRNQSLELELEMMEDVQDDLDGMTSDSPSGKVSAYVANGEIGRVVDVAVNRVVLAFETPKRIVTCPRAEGADIDGFDLGYAISCHKSQGSQWKVVIIALDPSGGARRICDRAWIYTAISRAEEVCFLVGKHSTMTAMCRQQKIDRRKTFLFERYIDELEKRVRELRPLKDGGPVADAATSGL